MCIIAYKPKGVKMPTKAVLKTCFNANPDGAGLAIMHPDSNKVVIEKGFMTFADFWDMAQCYDDIDSDIAYHFRITTSGGTRPENCHPFPVSASVTDITKLSTTAKYAFIHNGVIGKGKGRLSDTMLYVKDVLAHIKDSLSDKRITDKIAKDTQGSRTILFDAERHKVTMTGKWITDKTGMLFSNNSYVPFDTSYCFDSIEPCIVCPICGAYDTNFVSEYHNLFECDNCYCLYDGKGEVWALGESDTF